MIKNKTENNAKTGSKKKNKTVGSKQEKLSERAARIAGAYT